MKKLDKLTTEEKEELIKNIKIAISNTKTAAETARYLNVNYTFLNRLCKKLNIFLPKNPSKKGTIDSNNLDEILQNRKLCKTSELKKRLIIEGIIENKCSKCGLIEWLNEKISLHLHHIDGNRKNNNLNNLMLLCPNCHSQTDNYCGKNSKINNVCKYTDEELIKAVNTSDNLYQVCDKLNIAAGRTYNILKRKMKELNINFENIEFNYLKKLTFSKDYSIRKNKQKYCSCGKEINYKSKTCKDCRIINSRKVKDRPSYEILKKEVDEYGYNYIGKKYNVCSRTIKKWLIQYRKCC
jgi:hypothetical protein